MDNLLRKAEAEGITVEYCHVSLNKSLSVQNDDGDFIPMDLSLCGAGADARVHLCHEIGHSVTGSFYSPYAAIEIRQKHENRANKWAIHELVPQEEFWYALEHGYTEIWQLAEDFNITEDFARKAVCLYIHGNLAVDMYDNRRTLSSVESEDEV